MLVTYGSPFQYVVFGPLGHPLAPSLESMTPEQYVHTMAFREQGFSSDRMPQYRDHTEANQDTGEAVEVEDGASLSSTLTTDSDTAGGVARTGVAGHGRAWAGRGVAGRPDLAWRCRALSRWGASPTVALWG